MVSACLLHHHPEPSGSRVSSSLAWQVPSAGIERLLELSQAVSLEDDQITPVQAWNYIRKHAQYAELEVTRLERLKEKLLVHVKCYGLVDLLCS